MSNGKTYRQPIYLTANDEPTNRVRCPIHGFIHFSDNERSVIDHRLFRRLRYIRQLALTELLYPGASHTRFEHSLGVMEVATRAFDSLASKHGDVLENAFQTVEGFQSEPLALARQSLRLAALLHDVGHASFSHAAEDTVFSKDSSHEKLSVEIIRQPDLMGGLLISTFGDVVVRTVAQIIEGGASLPPQLAVLRDLVSGQMDADRTDYLLRDSHHCGVDYGKFDYRRMIECLELAEGDFGEPLVALNRDGLHTFEALILARYQMNVQVYYHRLRRIYDVYLTRYHQELGKDETFTNDVILSNNDVTMMYRILKDAQDPNCGPRHKWARLIAERKHHRMVHDTGVNAKPQELAKSVKLLPKLEGSFNNIEFIRDIAHANIHKLLTPDDTSDENTVRTYLISSSGQRKPIGFESQILSKIPKSFSCARIFADIEAADQEMRAEIDAYASRTWKELPD